MERANAEEAAVSSAQFFKQVEELGVHNIIFFLLCITLHLRKNSEADVFSMAQTKIVVASYQ